LFDELGLLPRVERYLVTEAERVLPAMCPTQTRKAYPDLRSNGPRLNLDLPWSTQGINPDEFDLVYASMLCIFQDLLFSLNKARLALASDGWS